MASSRTPEAASSGSPAVSNVTSSKSLIHDGGSESHRQRALTPLEEKLKTARDSLEKLTGLDLHQSVSVESAHSLALRDKRQQKSAASRPASRQAVIKLVPSAAEDPVRKISHLGGPRSIPDQETPASSPVKLAGGRSFQSVAASSRGAADSSPAGEQSLKGKAAAHVEDEAAGRGGRSTSSTPASSSGPEAAEASVGLMLPPASAESPPRTRVLPYHTAHRQLFNLSLLRTSTQHWERDKTLLYTPVGATSVSMPATWPMSLRGGPMLYCPSTKPAPAIYKTLSFETLQLLLATSLTKKQVEARRHKKRMRMKADGLLKHGEDEEDALSDDLGDLDTEDEQGEDDASSISLMRRRVDRLARQMGVGPEAVMHLIRLHIAAKAERTFGKLGTRLRAKESSGKPVHAEGFSPAGQPSAAAARVMESGPVKHEGGSDTDLQGPSTPKGSKDRACIYISPRLSAPPSPVPLEARLAAGAQHAAVSSDALATIDEGRCAPPQVYGMKSSKDLMSLPLVPVQSSPLIAGSMSGSSQGSSARGMRTGKLHVALPEELSPRLAPGAVRQEWKSASGLAGEAEASTGMASKQVFTDPYQARNKQLLLLGLLDPPTRSPPRSYLEPNSPGRSLTALQSRGSIPSAGATLDSAIQLLLGQQSVPAGASSFFISKDGSLPNIPASNWQRGLAKAKVDFLKNRVCRDMSLLPEDCRSSSKPSLRSRAAPLAATMLRQLKELGSEEARLSQGGPEGVRGSPTGTSVASGFAVKGRQHRHDTHASAPVRPLLTLESPMSLSSKVKRMLNDARQFGDSLDLLERNLVPIAHRMRG